MNLTFKLKQFYVKLKILYLEYFVFKTIYFRWNTLKRLPLESELTPVSKWDGSEGCKNIFTITFNLCLLCFVLIMSVFNDFFNNYHQLCFTCKWKLSKLEFSYFINYLLCFYSSLYHSNITLNDSKKFVYIFRF